MSVVDGPESPRRLDGPAALGLVLALLSGLVLRVTHLVLLSELPMFVRPDGDAAVYHVIAQRFAAGDYLLGHEGMRMSPGYQYFLGLVYAALGDGPWAFRIVQAVMGLALVLLVWDSARRLLGARWAALPAIAAACYGPFLFYESTRLATGLAAFTHMLLLWLVLRAFSARRVSAVGLLAIGLAWGSACVVRPNALLLAAPLLPAVLAFAGVGARLRARLAALSWVGLGLALALSPVATRNWLATHELVLLTTHGGFNFFIGNGPGAKGSYRKVPGAEADGPGDQFAVMKAAAEAATGADMTDREVDAYWFGRTRAAVLHDPLRWLRLMARKLRLFWNGRELSNNYDYEFLRAIDPVLGLPLPQFSWFAGLSVMGSLVLLWARGPERFVGGFCWAVCLGVCLVFVLSRYRMPVVAPALIAATHGLRALLAAARAGRLRELSLRAGLLACGIWLSVPVAVAKHFDNEYFKLAAGYHELGQARAAEAAYLAALEHNPGHLHARHNLAILYESLGADDAARTQWQALRDHARAQGDEPLRHKAEERLTAP